MTRNGAASGAPDTVPCPGQGTNELATLGFSEKRSAIIHRTVLGEPTKQRSHVRNSWLQKWTVHSQKSEQRCQDAPYMSGVPPDCPV
jgi:hypothetical protein